MQRLVVIVILAVICIGPNYIGVQAFVVPQDRGQRVSGSTGVTNTMRKLALVIGNGAYTEAPLKNPANDASDMAATLKQLGFEVMSATNANQREMKRLIREFGTQLRTGGIGVFFYAGHGMQVNGRNYLIPIGATINTEPDVEDEAVDVNLLLGQFDVAGNGLNIVILDACRNNPFGRSFRSVEKGLAQMTAPTGTVVVYSTAPGRIASDGNTHNGLFTQELLTNLKQPGMRLEDILINTRVAVKSKSGGQQVPWENGALEGVFYFVPPVTSSGGSSTSITAETVEEDAWNEIKDSTRAEDFKVFLREFPDGKRAPLARVKLAKLESPPVPVKPTLAVEEDAWNEIKDSMRAEDFKVFLREFPDGKRAPLARVKLAKLESPPVPIKPALVAGSRVQFGGMEFVYIPAGSFQMGGDKFDNEKPVHQVTISQGFYLGKYEVTQGEWEAVMGSNPSHFKGSARLPVEQVSWEDVQEFIKKLNEVEGRDVYRLPSEAEWEYACRAGTRGDYAGKLDSMGWYDKNAGGKTHLVGEKSPNKWGLYDMHGNVWEWSGDSYGEEYYQNSPSVDPRGPSTGSDRMIRGGSWDNIAVRCRSAYRYYSFGPGDRSNSCGFRLVRMVDW